MRNESPLSLPLPIVCANKDCADTVFVTIAYLFHQIMKYNSQDLSKQRAALDLHKFSMENKSEG